MTKISLVLPIYNVEKYLPLCLDSIRAQTYRNFEVICVIDGSQDRSEAILNAYSRLDDRIITIKKQNGGVSSARNVGLDNSEGDIVWFVDPDDVIEPNACKTIAEAFEGQEPDVFVFGANIVPDHWGDPALEALLSPRDAIFDGFESNLMFKEASHPFPWRMALSRSFLIENNIRFDEDIKFGEDEIFCYAVYPRAKRVVLSSAKLYVYRARRPDSLMSIRAENNILKLYEHLRVVDRICSDWSRGGFIEEHHEGLLCSIAEFVIWDIFLAPSNDRLILFRFFRSIIEAYFTEEQVSSVLFQHRLYGPAAKAILSDAQLAWRGRRKLIIYRHTLMTDPFDFVRGIWRRIASLWPLRSFGIWLDSKLPMSAKELRLITADNKWATREGTDLLISKTLLDYELGCRK